MAELRRGASFQGRKKESGIECGKLGMPELLSGGWGERWLYEGHFQGRGLDGRFTFRRHQVLKL